MVEFEEGRTLGQIIDGLADEYFAAGADAFSANLRALLDVLDVYHSAVDLSVKLFDSTFRSRSSEVSE